MSAQAVSAAQMSQWGLHAVPLSLMRATQAPLAAVSVPE
jgi:hypothetical protein